MPNAYMRQAFESIPGNETNTPTLSTKKLFVPARSFGPKLAPNHLERDDEMRGQDEPIPVLPQKLDPSFDIDSRAYPDVLGHLLKWILGPPVSTAGNGVITAPDATVIPVGATRHVWAAPFGPAGASPLTSQLDIAYADQAAYFKMKGAALSELSIESPEEGGVGLTGSGPACYLDVQTNPSLTPAYEALTIRPFTRADLTLPTWLSGSGTHENFGVTIENPVEAFHSMGIKSKYPDVMEKSNEGPIIVRGELSQRQLATIDWSALKDATGFAAQAKWISDSTIAATAYAYKLFLEQTNCQYVEGDAEELGNKRRHGASFNWKSSTASVGSSTLTLINATASYA